MRATLPNAQVLFDVPALHLGWAPDILITRDDGTRLAIELHFSTLTEVDWRARHGFYRDNHMVGVWLFAPTGPMFEPTTVHGQDTRVRLLPLHRAMLTAGVTPLWFNPIWSLIGTAQRWQRPFLRGLGGVRRVSTTSFRPGPRRTTARS